MSSTIEFTLSSPCPAHRDAILSWVVEGSESPAASAAAEHVKRCAACREFRDSLKMQRVLVKRQSSVVERTPNRIIEQRINYAEWIATEFDSRHERDVARSLWLCAQELFRFSTEVARRIHHEECVVPQLERPSEIRHDLATNIRDSLSARRGRSRRRSATGLANAIEQLVGGVDEHVRTTTHGKLVGDLLDAADNRSSKISSQTNTIRGFGAWYGQRGGDPGSFFDAAVGSATSVAALGHALGNLSLWHFENGRISFAIQLAENSLQACDDLIFARVNLVMWLSAVGDIRQARDKFHEIRARIGLEGFRSRWPWSLIAESITNISRILGVPEKGRAEAMGNIWEITAQREISPIERLGEVQDSHGFCRTGE